MVCNLSDQSGALRCRTGAHVRPSVHGPKKTGEPHDRFCHNQSESVLGLSPTSKIFPYQRTLGAHISLVFREMWDTRAVHRENLYSQPKSEEDPHDRTWLQGTLIELPVVQRAVLHSLQNGPGRHNQMVQHPGRPRNTRPPIWTTVRSISIEAHSPEPGSLLLLRGRDFPK